MESCSAFPSFTVVGLHVTWNDFPSVRNCERGRALLSIMLRALAV
jgi:hypothetical protein